MVYYIVTVSMPGYLPNAEPVVVDDERAPTRILEYLRDEIEAMMPEPTFESEGSTNFDERTDAWDAIYAEVASDLEHAADFDTSPGSGFRYDLPDGNVLEATAHTREQLIELGYKPSEDF